jgi:hypothetical protein
MPPSSLLSVFGGQVSILSAPCIFMRLARGFVVAAMSVSPAAAFAIERSLWVSRRHRWGNGRSAAFPAQRF